MELINKISDAESRIFAWIKYTGTYNKGGWSSCKATSRVVGFLEALSMDYTIENTKAWFTLLDHEDSLVSFWNIRGASFAEEIHFLKNLANIRGTLKVEQDEELAFMMMLQEDGYTYKGSEGRLIILKV